jgi:hypothetical protein
MRRLLNYLIKNTSKPKLLISDKPIGIVRDNEYVANNLIIRHRYESFSCANFLVNSGKKICVSFCKDTDSVGITINLLDAEKFTYWYSIIIKNRDNNIVVYMWSLCSDQNFTMNDVDIKGVYEAIINGYTSKLKERLPQHDI